MVPVGSVREGAVGVWPGLHNNNIKFAIAQLDVDFIALQLTSP